MTTGVIPPEPAASSACDLFLCLHGRGTEDEPCALQGGSCRRDVPDLRPQQ